MPYQYGSHGVLMVVKKGMWRWELWCRKTWRGKKKGKSLPKRSHTSDRLSMLQPSSCCVVSWPYVNSSTASLPKYQLPIISSCCWRTLQQGLPFWEARISGFSRRNPIHKSPRGNCLPQVNNHHPLNLLLCVREVILSHDCRALFSFRAPLCMWGARQRASLSPVCQDEPAWLRDMNLIHWLVPRQQSSKIRKIMLTSVDAWLTNSVWYINAYLNMEDSLVSPHPAQSTASALRAVWSTALMKSLTGVATVVEGNVRGQLIGHCTSWLPRYCLARRLSEALWEEREDQGLNQNAIKAHSQHTN